MDFVAGCIAGSAGCIASHPLDTIKVRMQCCNHTGHAYKGTLDCFMYIVRKESFRGLFKGLSSPLATMSVVNAVCFGTHGYALRRCKDPKAIRSHFYAGAAAGLALCPLLCPIELVKCKMQMQHIGRQLHSPMSAGTPTLYTGSIHCITYIYKREGVAGWFRGMYGTVVREVPGIAVYFPTFEWLKQVYQRYMGVDSCPLLYLFLAGGMSGCVAWASSYPVDVIKSRLQCDGVYDPGRKKMVYKYSGYMDCVHKSLAAEGPSVFFRGLSSTCLRSFPNNGVTLALLAVIRSFVQQGDNSENVSINEISTEL